MKQTNINNLLDNSIFRWSLIFNTNKSNPVNPINPLPNSVNSVNSVSNPILSTISKPFFNIIPNFMDELHESNNTFDFSQMPPPLKLRRSTKIINNYKDNNDNYDNYVNESQIIYISSDGTEHIFNDCFEMFHHIGTE